GTYNLDAFSQAVSSNGVKVLSETPGSVKGITTIEYQIPAYDRAGNVIGYKAQPFTKTVYDPKVISDQKVLDLGRQAAASGYVKAVASGDRYYDSTAGGITFRVYLDERTGAVLNFYPK
ncbi:CdiA family toxin C-terminal domain-containing protein, partial [Pseudomonas aeruginosa]